MQIDDGLDTLHGLGGGHDLTVVLRIHQFHPEGVLDGVHREDLLDRGVLVDPLVLLEGVFLGLVVDLLDLRIALQGSLDRVLVRLACVLAGHTVVAGNVLHAQEDRHLDLVVPLALDEVDLLGRQQRGTEQRQRDPHRDDDGNRHADIASQTVPGLSQGVSHVVSPWQLGADQIVFGWVGMGIPG